MSMFTTGLFLICLARSAKRNVEIVYEMLCSLGLIVANITVFALPPSESFSNIVSGELRYGMCGLPFTIVSITVPNADNDKLMLHPSFKVSPVALVLLCRSLPARSTKFNLLLTIRVVPSSVISWQSMYTVKSECERELTSLRSVEAVRRRYVPSFINRKIYYGEVTGNKLHPLTKKVWSRCSCTSSGTCLMANKSRTLPLYSYTNETFNEKRLPG